MSNQYDLSAQDYENLHLFSAYQKYSNKTLYKDINTNHKVVYPMLGLCNEAGELAGKVKKIFRDNDGKISDEMWLDLHDEIGDVLWYLSQVCTALNISLSAVAIKNIEKVYSRAQRGVLKGSGDKR